MADKINLKNVTSNPKSLTDFMEISLNEIDKPIEYFKGLENKVILTDDGAIVRRGVFGYHNKEVYLLDGRGYPYKEIRRLWVEVKSK